MKAVHGMLFAVLFVAIFVSAIAPSLAIKAGGSVLFIAAIIVAAFATRTPARRE